MATKLFRSDSFQREFDAVVREQTTHLGKPAIVLDQTAFYPSAGGQPNDTGVLGGQNVIDVAERNDGEILHIVENAPVFSVGQLVHGAIFWPRRWDHMQQHSGQHVLSAAFVQACKLDTIAVHISTDHNTLDLPSGQVSRDQLVAAEELANQCIFDDRLFKIYEVTDAGLAAVPLRKVPKVTGLIRIVEVDGFDWSACGGTHVRSTGQIGMIKIDRADKKGNETRIIFRCGVRALAHYRALNDLTGRISTEFNIGPQDLETHMVKLRDESRVLQKQLGDAQTHLLSYEVAELLSAVSVLDGDGPRVVVQSLCNRDINQLRALAKALCEHDGVTALLGSINAEAHKTQLCFARSPRLTTDMRVVLKAALASFADSAANGGGSVDFAQGSAPLSSESMLVEALAQARHAVNAHLT